MKGPPSRDEKAREEWGERERRSGRKGGEREREREREREMKVDVT